MNCKTVTGFGIFIFFLAASGCVHTKPVAGTAPGGIEKKYGIIDSHNHDASGYRYRSTKEIRDRYGVAKVILFGNISEPEAMKTDEIALAAYREDPERIIPFIAGINIFSPDCLTYISERFEAGAFGIGEIVAASSRSPATSKLPWKGKDALDGFLPEIYELCGSYGKPILLHIDPPDTRQIRALMDAAAKYPRTNFILAHANAYTSPKTLETILSGTSNIFLDFFAGFTAWNPASGFTLDDFVPLIEAFPDRFVVSTDSGYDVGYEKANAAMVRLLALLSVSAAEKTAHGNIERLLNIRND